MRCNFLRCSWSKAGITQYLNKIVSMRVLHLHKENCVCSGFRANQPLHRFETDKYTKKMGGHFIKFIYFFFLTLIRDNTNKKTLFPLLFQRKEFTLGKLTGYRLLRNCLNIYRILKLFSSIYSNLFKLVTPKIFALKMTANADITYSRLMLALSAN